MDYYRKSSDDVFKALKARKPGLSSSEAEKRQEKHGLNVTKEEKKASVASIFFSQFNDFFVYMLLFAGVVTLFLGHAADFFAIFAILFLIVIFGFIQNYKAEKAIRALKKLAETRSRVMRDGQVKEIPSSEVTIGDILLLTEGDKVPADARLFESHNLLADESSITGESLAVHKTTRTLSAKGSLAIGDMKNCVFAGTNIVEGNGKAIVFSIGKSTEIGKIASMIEGIKEEKTPLQKRLGELAKKLSIAILIVAAFVFVMNILIKGDFSLAGINNNFLIAVSLAVAAVPQGLPAVITISMALGTRAMAKNNALIRRLPSVETLGSTSVICTDKTGTLTKNEMTVEKIYFNRNEIDVAGSGFESNIEFQVKGKKASPRSLEPILKTALVCNNSLIQNKLGKITFSGDPTEAALSITAMKAGITANARKVKEFSFSSRRKMMSVAVKENGKLFLYSKGAPDVLLKKSRYILVNGKKKPLDTQERKRIEKAMDSFAASGMRVLGFACRELRKGSLANLENSLVFLGLMGMIDPLREEVAQSIRDCRSAGIEVKMITGDYPLTAKAIGKKIGMKGKVITGAELELLNEKGLQKAVSKYDIFARVNPEHKLRIVAALQKNRHVVAMTGDGVNDSPALKKADIGISMGINGTEVAKEASDMILLDNSFKSIAKAVFEGRRIFNNIKKFVLFMLSTNLSEVLVILIPTIMGYGILPLAAIQILWINLITDGPPSLALGVDPASRNIMKEKPRKNSNFIDTAFIMNIIIVASIITAATLAIFFINAPSQPLEKTQTMVFLSLISFEILRLYHIRKKESLGFFSNRWLILAVAASIILTFIAIYSPLNVFLRLVPLTLVELGYVMLTLGAGLIAIVVFDFLAILIKKSRTERAA